MSGRVAAFKVATRNAKRNKRRTFLLVALVASPVFVAVLAAGYMRASHLTEVERVEAEFGNATLSVTVYSATHGGVADWVRATASEIDPEAEILVRRVAQRSWGDQAAEITDIDLDTTIGGGLLRVVSGRPPSTSGEIAITEYLSDATDVGLGGTLTTDDSGDAGRRFQVVGLLSHPVLWAKSQAVVTPAVFDDMSEAGELAAMDQRVLIAASDDMGMAQRILNQWSADMYLFHPDEVGPMPPELSFLPDSDFFALDAEQLEELATIARTQGEPAAWDAVSAWLYTGQPQVVFHQLFVESKTERLSWNTDNALESAPVIGSAVAAVLLAEVAFIAGAAFATGIRRRLREIGLMGANGADDEHIKATVVGEGLVVGIIGGLAGATIATVALMFGRPLLQRFVERRIDEFPLAGVDLLGPVILAVLACLFAAWLPSRSASTVPTLTALQGRMPAAQPRRRVSVIGVLMASIGTLLFSTGLASRNMGSGGDTVTVLGVALMIGGVAMLAGPIVAWVSRHANRFPISGRIVLRDSGRHRTRAAAAVAATMVIMILPIAGMAGGASSVASERIYGLSTLQPQLLVRGHYDPDTFEVNPFTPATLGALEAAMSGIRGALPGVETAEFLATTAEVHYPAKWAVVQGGGSLDMNNDMYWVDPVRMAIANPDLLRLLDDERLERALASEGMALIGIEGRRTSIGVNGINVDLAEVPLAVPRQSFPRFLVTPKKAADMGIEPTVALGMATAEGRSIDVFGPGFWSPALRLDRSLDVNTSTGGASLMPLVMAVMLLATLGVVLIVVAIITALSATEADGDLQTMVAVGAANSIRRKYLGLQSWMHTALGTLLAIPLALLLVSTAVRAGYGWQGVGSFGEYSSRVLHISFAQLGILFVVLPLVVGAFTFAFVRSAPLTPPQRAF